MDLKTLYKISYGMYIITSKSNEKINGFIANTVFQITAEPPTIAVSVNKNNLTHKYIEESKVFTASILNKECPLPFLGKFGYKSGYDIDKFVNVKYNIGQNMCPIITENTAGYIEAKVVSSIDMGTHTVFIGEVVNCETFSNEEVMTYGYYHEVKGGKSPKNAPTYQEDRKKEVNNLSKYVCSVCGYVYDPAVGDPDSGIAPGTPFEDIPSDWVCPVCGVTKDMFEKEN